MDEQTPSKRITKGMQTNTRILNDFSFYFLDLTQNFQEILSVAKSRFNQQEIRSVSK